MLPSTPDQKPPCFFLSTSDIFNPQRSFPCGVSTSRIKKIIARAVIDSRGNPTVQADVFSEKGFGRATAPSGASTGVHEALELRDGGKKFGGKGVSKAVANVNSAIARRLSGMDAQDQLGIDAAICSLDGTPNKAKLGANATTAVSLAVAQCAASEKGIGLYRVLPGQRKLLPTPMMNVLNGGKHASNGVAIQEFMIFPLHFKSFSDALCAGTEIYHELSSLVQKKYGKAAIGLGDEGGFAPPCKSGRDALALLESAIGNCGYSKDVELAIDAASSSFFDAKSGNYNIDGKSLSAQELSDLYVSLAKEFPIASMEDPFEEESFSEFASLRKKLSGRVQIVGDDLLVTNVSRIKTAIAQRSCSSLLLKVNQIGTLSESLSAADLCAKNKMGVIVSHRSGETEDTAIADIAVGIGCGQIKCGSLARSERTCKYNRLLQIEEELGANSFAGASCLAR
ncbi:MAG: phosphopyruvate hydratase [Candidatus Anstonellaceae archaeon]